MDVGEVVTVVVGALIAYIIADTLITNLITGTSTGDTLNRMGAFKSNLGWKTSQIRGTLKRLIRHANPEPSPIWEGVETRRFAPFGVVG